MAKATDKAIRAEVDRCARRLYDPRDTRPVSYAGVENAVFHCAIKKFERQRGQRRTRPEARRAQQVWFTAKQVVASMARTAGVRQGAHNRARRVTAEDRAATFTQPRRRRRRRR